MVARLFDAPSAQIIKMCGRKRLLDYYLSAVKKPNQNKHSVMFWRRRFKILNCPQVVFFKLWRRATLTSGGRTGEIRFKKCPAPLIY